MINRTIESRVASPTLSFFFIINDRFMVLFC